MNLADNMTRVIVLLALSIVLIFGTGCDAENPDQKHTADPALAAVEERAGYAGGSDAAPPGSQSADPVDTEAEGVVTADENPSGIAHTTDDTPDRAGTANEPPQAAQPGIQLPDPSTRRPAPDFTLQDVEGRDVRLADYRGKVVLLKFWATWCAPCRMEVPDFINLQRDYSDRGVEVIAISMDREGARVVAPFVKQHGINYRVLVDGTSVVNRLGGIPGVPTTFLLDRQGRVVGSLSGYNPPDVWKALAEAALAEG